MHGIDPYAVVLGTAQDAGYPSAGCRRDCCRRAVADPALARMAACLALLDPGTSRRWLIDCTPQFPQQLALLDELAPSEAASPGLVGILLTHAHIGHYAGLIHLGREVLGTRGLPVHVMPRMGEFLRSNGPWSQLVELGNIELKLLEAGRPLRLSASLSIVPVPVPHRAEYSETVAFRISGPSRSILYLPDIDTWDACQPSIEKLLESVDLALLDGTFFSGMELPGRDMREIPHPTVTDSMARFAGLRASERGKVRFLHLNHSNPLLNPHSAETALLLEAGYALVRQGELLQL
jgi:pyrroloquinoline quinone biosynthesis protein B